MGFFAMCLIGYKIVAFLLLAAIGFFSLVFPLWLACEYESLIPIALYIICVPVVCLCIKLMQLL